MPALVGLSKKKARGRRRDCLPPRGPRSSLFPNDRLSFSLGQRCDVAAAGRDAIEGQPESRLRRSCPRVNE